MGKTGTFSSNKKFALPQKNPVGRRTAHIQHPGTIMENENHFIQCDENPYPNASLTSTLSKIFNKNDIDPQLRILTNEVIQTGTIKETNHPDPHQK